LFRKAIEREINAKDVKDAKDAKDAFSQEKSKILRLLRLLRYFFQRYIGVQYGKFKSIYTNPPYQVVSSFLDVYVLIFQQMK